MKIRLLLPGLLCTPVFNVILTTYSSSSPPGNVLPGLIMIARAFYKEMALFMKEGSLFSLNPELQHT